MDHAEEQSQELEALQSIYYDSFESVSDDPNAFRIHIKPEDYAEAMEALERKRAAQSDSDDEGEEGPANFYLKVTYTPNYPEEVPEMEVEDASALLAEENMEGLLEELRAAAEENLGMPMVFTLATLAKEKLEDLIKARLDAAENERTERLLREEMEEQKRREGTKVTTQEFAAWKKRFEKEMLESGRTDLVWITSINAKSAVKGKLTGKQLFEQNKGLAMSDAQYLDAGDATIDVSLFDFDEEEIGDLELDESEEENEVLQGLTED